MKKLFSFLLLITTFSLLPLHIEDTGSALLITSIYGKHTVTEPVVVDLIKSNCMQRLKGIRQYGSTFYAREEENYTRFEHSVGVFLLLRDFGASLEEQIAGLLHDASHTVFSHVADHVFVHDKKMGAYQDNIHEWFLEKIGALAILEKHGIDTDAIINIKKSIMLKQPYPDVCGDRLEYNLKGAWYKNLISTENVSAVISHLHFENNIWFFDSVEHARIFAHISLNLCANNWGAPWHHFVYHCTALALRQAFVIDILCTDDMHFSTDDAIWQTLAASTDPVIQKYLYNIRNFKASYKLGTQADHDTYVEAKFSGIDPLIKINGNIVRLSSVDSEFKKEYEKTKQKVEAGYYLSFTESCQKLVSNELDDAPQPSGALKIQPAV